MPITVKQHPTKKYLNLNYDYYDGSLYSKETGKQLAKIKTVQGYIKVKLKYVGEFTEHRLIYIWHFGRISNNLQVDHIDNNKSNNKIENLRLLTGFENCMRVAYDKKLIKYRDLDYCFKNKVWQSFIIVNNKKIKTKKFKEIEDANKAKIALMIKYKVLPRTEHNLEYLRDHSHLL